MTTVTLFEKSKCLTLPIKSMYDDHFRISNTRAIKYYGSKLEIMCSLKADKNKIVTVIKLIPSVTSVQMKSLYNNYEIFQVEWQFGDKIITKTLLAEEYFQPKTLLNGISSIFNISRQYVVKTNGYFKISYKMMQKPDEFLIFIPEFTETTVNSVNDWITYEEKLFNVNDPPSKEPQFMTLQEIEDKLIKTRFNTKQQSNKYIKFQGIISNILIDYKQKNVIVTDKKGHFVKSTFDVSYDEMGYKPRKESTRNLHGELVQITGSIENIVVPTESISVSYIQGITMKYLCKDKLN